MPKGYPVATMAIGSPGASNAALLAASILALEDKKITLSLDSWRKQMSASVDEYPRD